MNKLSSLLAVPFACRKLPKASSSRLAPLEIWTLFSTSPSSLAVLFLFCVLLSPERQSWRSPDFFPVFHVKVVFACYVARAVRTWKLDIISACSCLWQFVRCMSRQRSPRQLEYFRFQCFAWFDSGYTLMRVSTVKMLAQSALLARQWTPVRVSLRS